MTKAEGDHLGTGNHPGTTPSRSEVSSALSDLLLRVEGATGPDREIDFAITNALVPDWAIYSDARCFFTSSLDAALALVTRVLPGWAGWKLERLASGRPWSRVYSSKGAWSATAATPALALLAAMLKALQQEGER